MKPHKFNTQAEPSVEMMVMERAINIIDYNTVEIMT